MNLTTRCKKDAIDWNKNDRHQEFDDRPKDHGEQPRYFEHERLCPNQASDDAEPKAKKETRKRTAHNTPMIPNFSPCDKKKWGFVANISDIY